jgi:UDP-N-acetylglucosamine 1-carboxyvinyltransferase
MALAAVARGTSSIGERVFPQRFQHVAELRRLGAQISQCESMCEITGVSRLSGATVEASDLRASAALVLAGLAADGQTMVHRVHYLDRGYERLDHKLAQLGGQVERLRESTTPAPPARRMPQNAK